MKTITLVVSYSRSNIPDYDFETRIKKLVKRDNSGSGYDLITGYRDLDFNFKVEKAAKEAIARVRSVKMRGVKCKLWYDDEE